MRSTIRPDDGPGRLGLEAVWSYLAGELRTDPANLSAPGVHLAAGEPLPRPYHQPPSIGLAGFQRGESLVITAQPGYLGLARAWLHRFGSIDQASGAEGLRWLRQHLARTGARLHVMWQYVLCRGDLAARIDPAVRRLGRDHVGQLAAELGWTPREARAWIGRGVYAMFVGARLACRVCVYPLTDRLAEVGVRTLPQFRHQGLARRTVAVATDELLSSHDAVLYTCGIDNRPSVAVAEALHARLAGLLLHALGPTDKPPDPGLL